PAETDDLPQPQSLSKTMGCFPVFICPMSSYQSSHYGHVEGQAMGTNLPEASTVVETLMMYLDHNLIQRTTIPMGGFGKPAALPSSRTSHADSCFTQPLPEFATLVTVLWQ
ncbi:hypothetical protein P7K49_026178, partial [Saguinus oedipus]